MANDSHLYLLFIVEHTKSQINTDVSEVLSSQIDGTCQSTLPSVTLYRADTTDALKRFTVLKFKDIHIKDEVEIIRAYLFFKVTTPFTLQENQTLFIAPIDDNLCSTCFEIDTITDFEESVQPHMITEWEFQYHTSHTLGLSPDISMYIKEKYGKHFPNKFSINFLVFWKEAEATLPLDVNNVELVINYNNYPEGINNKIEHGIFFLENPIFVYKNH